MSYTVIFYLKNGLHYIKDDLNTYADAMTEVERDLMDDEDHEIKSIEVLLCKNHISADEWRARQ